MNDILIVSDSTWAHNALETGLRNAHSPIGLISLITVLAMFGGASYVAKQYQFVLLVIDADFRKRYGSVITEMSAMIRNYSTHTSIYLMFEDDYHPAFSEWLPYTDRIFHKISAPSKLNEAIKQLIEIHLDLADKFKHRE